MYASTFMRLCTVWLDSETCSRVRHGESTRGGRCSRLNEASSVLQQCSPAIFICIGKLFVRTQHTHWKRPRRVVGKTGSDICAAIPCMSVRFQGSVVARREVSVSMSSFCWSCHKQIEASTSFEAVSTHGTAQLLRRAVLSSMLQFLVLVTLSDVLRDGSIDISAIHCPRGQVLTHVANLNYSFCTISWVVSRMCEFTMSVHSRTVNVLWNKRLSIVLHKCRFPSLILSFGIQLCLRLTESSARSSSQSEDGVHQDAYERPSAMAGWWLCSVMTSYISSRIHGCCQRNRPLRTKRGACRRISFRAACLSECAQTCPSDRRNHLAPVRNLQLRLRRHSAIGTRATSADRWCSTLGRCALRRDIPPMHLASSSATLGGRRVRA